MSDLDWAYRKAREIWLELQTSRRSGPHNLGRHQGVILEKVREFEAGNDAPIRQAEDD